MKYCYRISKNHKQSSSDWTSISDIEEQGDKNLFLREYLRTETLMLDAVIASMEAIGAAELNVIKLHVYQPCNSLMDLFLNKTSPGSSVSIVVAIEMLRASLREDIWCFLSYGDDYWVCVGDDFNIHVASSVDIDKYLLCDFELIDVKRADWLEGGMREQCCIEL